MKTWEQKQLVANILQLSSYNKTKLENQELKSENKLLRKQNTQLKAVVKRINDDTEGVLKENWTA
jgi:cell shape-determining protein MreC